MPGGTQNGLGWSRSLSRSVAIAPTDRTCKPSSAYRLARGRRLAGGGICGRRPTAGPTEVGGGAGMPVPGCWEVHLRRSVPPGDEGGCTVSRGRDGRYQEACSSNAKSGSGSRRLRRSRSGTPAPKLRGCSRGAPTSVGIPGKAGFSPGCDDHSLMADVLGLSALVCSGFMVPTQSLATKKSDCRRPRARAALPEARRQCRRRLA